MSRNPPEGVSSLRRSETTSLDATSPVLSSEGFSLSFRDNVTWIFLGLFAGSVVAFLWLFVKILFWSQRGLVS